MSETPTTPAVSEADANDAARIEGPVTGESLAARIGWAVLIAVTLYVCYLSNLGAIGFVGPDEPRYAWIARAMAESGDWVTPRLYGVPWFEKPVLYYWGAGLSFKIFGISETAARLPSALSALLATLALAWLALRIHGAATARWLLLLLPTTVGMIGFSHAAATDMPFSGMLTVAMVCAAVAMGLTRNERTPILPRTPWLALALFGFFLGLAVLAKGPAAIILAGGAVFFWAIFTKRWRDAFRLLHPVAIAAFCATALPWYILCARRNADFFRVFIVEHNFKRYLTPEFQHTQPFWFYLPVLLVALLPWIGLFGWSAVLGLRAAIRRPLRDGEDVASAAADKGSRAATTAAGRKGSPSGVQERLYDVEGMDRFLICWAGFCLVFFSTSHSKLPGYILPAIPAIGLLMARVFVAARERHRASLRIAHLGAVIGFGFLFFALEYMVAGAHFGEKAGVAGTLGAVILSLALANLILGATGGWLRSEVAAAGAVLPILVAMLFVKFFLPPFFNGDPSGRTLAREVQRQHIPAGVLSVSGMNRALQYSLSFYLHDEIKNWDTHSETGGYLLTSGKDCERVVGAAFFCEAQTFDSQGTGSFLFLVIPIAGDKVASTVR